MTKKRASPVVMALNVVLWCGVGYVGLAIVAMHLGEVMHDIHCLDHR
jgi:UDP-glucose 6-dehydrogenase